MHDETAAAEIHETQTFVEGLDFYFENDLMILTKHYLARRGTCCNNDCRHCPFKADPL